jgi:hypothetical protein
MKKELTIEGTIVSHYGNIRRKNLFYVLILRNDNYKVISEFNLTIYDIFASNLQRLFDDYEYEIYTDIFRSDDLNDLSVGSSE